MIIRGVTILLTHFVIDSMPNVEIGPCVSESIYADERLADCILARRKYNFLRPSNEKQEPVTVKITSALYKIVEVNEADETVTYVEWMGLNYVNEYFTWNPLEFDNITALHFPSELVWIPDIVILNAREIKPLDERGQVKAIIYPSGMTMIMVARRVTVSCQLNLADFPFDVQTCAIQYLSYSETGEHVHFGLADGDKPANISDAYQNNREWALIQYEATEVAKIDSAYEFIIVVYKLTVGRRPDFYIRSYVIPTFVITTIAIVGIFTPSEHTLHRTERTSLGSTALLALAVVFTAVFDMMPAGAGSMPRLGKYILHELLLVVACTCISAMIMHVNSLLNRRTTETKLKTALRKNGFSKSQEEQGKPTVESDWSDKVSIWLYWLDVLLMSVFLIYNTIVSFNYATDKQHYLQISSQSL